MSSLVLVRIGGHFNVGNRSASCAARARQISGSGVDTGGASSDGSSGSPVGVTSGTTMACRGMGKTHPIPTRVNASGVNVWKSRHGVFTRRVVELICHQEH